MRFAIAIFLSVFMFGLAAAQESAPASQPAPSGEIAEAELNQQLAGKFLYLRGGYLDNSLNYNDRGVLTGNSPKGSYTLSVIRIDKIRLTRRRLELEGLRYGLHFLGALPNEDPGSAVDRVRITPRKKWVRITITRMKVAKLPKKRKGSAGAQTPLQSPGANTTTSPAFAATVLRQAIGNVFASTLDARMMAAMPDFWRLYYEAASAKSESQSAPAGVLSVSDVDRKPKLLTKLQASSNQYAQVCGVAGMALYHAVIGADGVPQQIAVARPIGFGLDENAVAAIRNAHFEPAFKDGRPVPVLLDLVVEFRIYSKRTAVASPAIASTSTAAPLPGPYTAEQQ